MGKNESNYTIPWLTRRQEQPEEEPDIEYVTMLEELCRGPQP